MADYSTQKPKRERGPIIKLQRFTMWSIVAGQPKKAQLVWSCQDGNPRLSVFFNNPDIQKPISFGMGLDTALGLFDLILGIARKPPGNTAIIENYINTYSQDDKVDGKRKASELHIGKNEQGVLWLGVKDVIAPKPSVQFMFTASDFHKFIVRDGDTPHPLPLAEVSQLMAVGYFNGLKDTYLRMATPADVGVTAHSLDDQDQQPAAAPQTQQRPANRAPGMEFSDMPQ